MWAYLLSIQFHSISAGAVLVAATRGHSYTTTQSPYTHTYTNTHTHQPPLLSTLLPRLSCFLSFSSGNVFFFFFFGPTSPSQIIQWGCGPDVRHQTPNLLKKTQSLSLLLWSWCVFFFFSSIFNFLLLPTLRWHSAAVFPTQLQIERTTKTEAKHRVELMLAQTHTHTHTHTHTQSNTSKAEVYSAGYNDWI